MLPGPWTVAGEDRQNSRAEATGAEEFAAAGRVVLLPLFLVSPSWAQTYEEKEYRDSFFH